MRRRTALALSGAAGLAAAGVAVAVWPDDTTTTGSPGPVPSGPGEAIEALHARYKFWPAPGPDRTLVTDQAGQAVAELTHGSRTVLLTGPERTFTEPQATKARVVSTWWVRMAPAVFHPTQLEAGRFAGWFLARLADRSDDVLAASVQYVTGAPERVDQAGVRYAHDAGFGYLNNESTRDGADFFDYLGVPWTWQDGRVSRPAAKWAGQVDCSGYLRLVYGYRAGMPMFRRNGPVDGLPRTAYSIAVDAPSTVIATPPSPDRAPEDLSRIRPGDVVFFALHDETPALITHSGIVLGPDTDGGQRFVSARQAINGPTFGDRGGRGVIDSGPFSRQLRRAIRL